MESSNTTTTGQIVKEFNSLIDIDVDYSLNEMKKVLSEVFKAKVAGAKPKKKAEPALDEDGNVIPKKRGRPAK
eukprot:1234120-Rhodomonas_salina.2